MVGDILQPTHLLLILVVALLVLGPKRLPEVGQKLGSGLRDFRQAINGESTPDRSEREEPEYIHAPPEPPHQTQPEQAESAEPVAAMYTPPMPPPAEPTAVPSTPDHEFVAGEAAPADKHEFAYESSESAEPRTKSGS